MDEYPQHTLESAPLDRALLDRALLDQVFQALADPTRRAMLEALGRGARSVGELAAPFEISLAAVSKHIKTLERAGLVRRTVNGRSHVCALDPAPLARAMAWLKSGPGMPAAAVAPLASTATASATGRKEPRDD